MPVNAFGRTPSILLPCDGRYTLCPPVHVVPTSHYADLLSPCTLAAEAYFSTLHQASAHVHSRNGSPFLMCVNVSSYEISPDARLSSAKPGHNGSSI